MASKREKVHFETVEELLGAPIEKDATTEIRIDQIFPFVNHPFKVVDDDKMDDLVESIKDNGVIVPVLVRPDDEATVAMVDSNLQREEILPSEKAFAYKMRYEAMKRQSKRNNTTSSQFGKKLWADQQLASDTGESKNQIHRYLRLAEVISPILDLVDRKLLAIVTAVEVSYLEPKVQEMIYTYMKENGICKAFQLYAYVIISKSMNQLLRWS